MEGGDEAEEEEEGVVLQEEGCPAVIVEEVPSAQVEECYSAQVLVYDDETYLMQDVAEEQEVVTEVAETGEAEPFFSLACCEFKSRSSLLTYWSTRLATCSLEKHCCVVCVREREAHRPLLAATRSNS